MVELCLKLSQNEDALFKALVEEIEKPPSRERPEHSWIRPSTWLLVDQQASMRKEGTLTQLEARRFTRRIRASLKEDRKERARRAEEAIILKLEAREIKEA